MGRRPTTSGSKYPPPLYTQHQDGTVHGTAKSCAAASQGCTAQVSSRAAPSSPSRHCGTVQDSRERRRGRRRIATAKAAQYGPVREPCQAAQVGPAGQYRTVQSARQARARRERRTAAAQVCTHEQSRVAQQTLRGSREPRAAAVQDCTHRPTRGRREPRSSREFVPDRSSPRRHNMSQSKSAQQ